MWKEFRGRIRNKTGIVWVMYKADKINILCEQVFYTQKSDMALTFSRRHLCKGNCTLIAYRYSYGKD